MKKKIIDTLKRCYRAFQKRTDPERYSIAQFMEQISREVTAGDIVLDAGAGVLPYKDYFSHAQYEATDFSEKAGGGYDFICTLDAVPRGDAYYSVIVCTQVLEHVPYPQKVINEFYRILKPGGKLFLTVPQGWPVHQAPHHYYNFTQYGLELLFDNAGFKTKFIRSRGGIFWYLGKRIGYAPHYIWRQYKNSIAGTLFFPLYKIADFICKNIICITLFYFDRLDKKQHCTLGYACYCTK